MDIESLREYCLSKKFVAEDFPFGEHTLVFRVKGKLFLLTTLNAQPVEFNVKCEPDRAVELREEYSSIRPGYHMNKIHWNTVTLDGSIPAKLVKQMIDDSYRLVAASLPKKDRFPAD